MENSTITYPEHITEEVRFGRRITSDYENTIHWLPIDLNHANTELKYRIVSKNKPTFITLGGIGTTNDRDANYVAKFVQRIIPIEGEANVISIIHSHYQGERAARYFDEDPEEHMYSKLHEAYRLVDTIFIPLLTDNDGNRLLIQDACKNIRMVNIFAHCYGHFTTVKYIEDALETTLPYFSYSQDEIDRIFKEIFVLSYEAGHVYQTKFTNVNINSIASELWQDAVLDFPNQDLSQTKMIGTEKEEIMSSEMFKTKDPALVQKFLKNNKYILMQNGNCIDIYTNGLTIDGTDHDLSTIYRHIDGHHSSYTNELGITISDTISNVLRYILQNSLKNKESRNPTYLNIDEIFKICSDSLQISRTFFGEVMGLRFD